MPERSAPNGPEKMREAEKIDCLLKMPLFRSFSRSQAEGFARILRPENYAEGSAVIEEKEKGESLFIIARGNVRVEKSRGSGQGSQELAVLGPGEFFGEMALSGQKSRTARVVALSDAVIFKLNQPELLLWLKAEQEAAGGLLMEMLQIQSSRLKETTRHLVMLYDLSGVLLEKNLAPKELAAAVCGHLLEHLEGAWSIAAFLYNPYNQEMDLAAAQGPESGTLAQRRPSEEGARGAAPGVDAGQGPRGAHWLDDATCRVFLTGPESSIKGYLLLSRSGHDEAISQDAIGSLVTAVSKFLSSALAKSEQEQEEALRRRLKSQSQGSRL